LLSAKHNNKIGQEIMTKASQIRSVETLACDAGWRNYHFVKIMTEEASSAGANMTRASARPE
jgi:hypothetical protein